jgi:hypothetical protein
MPLYPETAGRPGHLGDNIVNRQRNEDAISQQLFVVRLPQGDGAPSKFDLFFYFPSIRDCPRECRLIGVKLARGLTEANS